MRTCLFVVSTLRRRGTVLLPCAPSGIVYDLLEVLGQHLANIGLAQTPFFLVSPVADASLAYANILGEWSAQAPTLSGSAWG